jgi:parallel beta-helix repeat protein
MDSISMEPKSIAFYTAVAVSILAVLSATTFPMAYAQQANTNTENENAAEPSDEASGDTSAARQPDNSEDDEAEETEETEDPTSANSDRGSSGTLGLSSGNGRITCGQTINEPNMEVVLTGDLACDGDGLIVNAPGVHVILNGYKITGNANEESGTQAEGLTMDYDGSTGILVNADDVMISGLGEVSDFNRGVTFMGSSNGQLTDVQIANNGIGVLVANSQDTEISRNTITNNDIAIVLDSSSGTIIAFNQIVNNKQNGIVLLGADESVVAANNMFANGEEGIYADIMSNGNNFEYNTVFGHSSYDLNNAGGQPPTVNGNNYGDNNNCGTSNPGGLCNS